MISHDIVTTTASGYATLQIRVNGSVRGYHLITNTNGQWDGMIAFQALKVNANDVVSIGFNAGDITSIDRGSWGPHNFLFHAV